MTTYNDQFKQYTDFQREAFEPFRAFTTAAVQTFERLARQHYAVLGDYVEFGVEQARLTTEVSDLNDYLGRQIGNTRAFGEKLARRAQEYAEIARASQEAATAATVAIADKRVQKKAA